jgi:hypothetical protein
MITIYQIPWRHISEYRELDTHNNGNLKSHVTRKKDNLIIFRCIHYISLCHILLLSCD